MRNVLQPLWEQIPTCAHPSLLYEAYAPIGPDGKVPEAENRRWLETIEERKLPDGYDGAFKRWKASMEADPTACLIEATLESRMLIGHGEPSASEVGLTLQRTWGVPFLPGTALKGLLANYLQTTYGPDKAHADKFSPFDPKHPEKERAPWQGVIWEGTTIERSPGEAYRILFGAPPADLDEEDGEAFGVSLQEAQGAVFFHDAWMLPTGLPDGKYLAVDVLTVHNATYHQKQGKGGSDPNDHDDPNPVAFLTVRPGLKFCLAVSGEPAWAAFALEHLCAALEAWGIGGKTSSGYGRLKAATSKGSSNQGAAARQARAAAASPEVQAFESYLQSPEFKQAGAKNKTLLIDGYIGKEPTLKQSGDAVWSLIEKAIIDDKRTKDWLAATKKQLAKGKA